jgi:TolB protein
MQAGSKGERMMCLRVLFRVTLCTAAALLISACGSGGDDGGGDNVDGGGNTIPLSLAQRYTIDGIVDFSGFGSVSQRTVSIQADLGMGAEVAAVELKWVILNDDKDIYFALEWSDSTYNNGFDFTGPTDVDGVVLLFDNDGGGSVDANEDQRTVIAASIGSQYIDQHVTVGDATDDIANGFAKLRYDAGIYQAEFLLPIDDDAVGQDGGFSDATRYNIQLFDHLQFTTPLTGNVGFAYTSGGDSSNWPRLPLVNAAVHQRPQLPTGLTGLIAFVSTHEEPLGDIYTFNPATGVVTRVTSDSGLFKDNISLSHDRTRIAFHGAPAADAYSDYEIYVVNVDGGGLVNLTNNSVLDGHPAWSPDDSRIAYASFIGSGGEAHVLLMDSSNGALIDDLTPDGSDDNDPEYLPDGRIVFKTDRFSALPQVRIAVMNEDGTGVSQLTAVSGVSDHDPVGDSAFAIFERFPKDTNYAADIETGFINWDIIEAALDGSGERRLLSDGWVNWLPVYDPSGQYIVYLKSAGYTAAHLMTRNGEQRGQLIPGITRLKYIDWK